MSRRKRKIKKQKARQDKVKVKLFKKRKILRESLKLERELEKIKKLTQPKLEPIRKDSVNETQL